jgi:hypothetical protein
VEEDDAAAVPLADVRVPHEGERAAVERFRDGVSELARARRGTTSASGDSFALPNSSQKPPGGEGGKPRVGPLYALLLFFYLIRVRVRIAILVSFPI